MLRNACGGGGVTFPGGKHYEGVMLNVISVRVGSNFQENSVT